MQFILTEITGLAQAIMSLTMSKRNWTLEEQNRIQKEVYELTDYRGFFLPDDQLVPVMRERKEKLLTYLDDVLCKWGAGVGLGAWLDDGHETLFRFIDVSFITNGLHRGAQDDLDAHAKRFDNRIVRSSTRLAKFQKNERSDWYKDKIRSMEDMLEETGYPDRYQDKDGITWIYTGNGYVREDLVNSNDVRRGNYPLSIPSDAIWKINFCDLRHVYMRRNIKTHAAPELRNGIDQLADQIEQAIPCNLGKLIRYDYALTGQVDGKNQYDLVHVMDIKKFYVPRD